jgi:hypothetical protein
MRRIVELITTFWSRVFVVPLLLALAEHDLRRDRLLSARRRFLLAAARYPASFRAHFGLARVYLCTDDVALARRELVLARQLAPARFRELRRQLPAPYRDEDLVAPPAAFRVVALAEPESDSGLGDCLDRGEWERFRELGPIRPDEAEDVDWDRLLSELGRQDA